MNVLEMDRRLTRAAELGRGIRFEAEDVALLIKIGLSDLLAEERSKFLKERARCLTIKTLSTAEENSSSTSTTAATGSPARPISTSGGIQQKPDGTTALLRARRMLNRPSVPLTSTT